MWGRAQLEVDRGPERWHADRKRATKRERYHSVKNVLVVSSSTPPNPTLLLCSLSGQLPLIKKLSPPLPLSSRPPPHCLNCHPDKLALSLLSPLTHQFLPRDINKTNTSSSLFYLFSPSSSHLRTDIRVLLLLSFLLASLFLASTPPDGLTRLAFSTSFVPIVNIIFGSRVALVVIKAVLWAKDLCASASVPLFFLILTPLTISLGFFMPWCQRCDTWRC